MSEVRAEAPRTQAATSERRPITVLFADIAGSTAIAERMDPEDWTAIVGQAFALMNRVVERYGGTVARLMGDGLLAFFGAPVAHEDDPERAVRCGLDMVKAIDGLSAEHRVATGADLRIRVGVNTGPVVVGIVGTDAAHEYTAMGDAVNVAARMQSHAEPGTVLITAATHRFVAPLVDARDVGEIELKGKADMVHAFAIRGLRAGAASPRGLSGIRAPLIGRDAELARLRQAFSVVRAGRGRVATVLGEPGLGKTRLLSELRIEAERADLPTTWIEGRCLSYGETIPYHLVIDLVRSMIGVSSSADEPLVREALAKRISETVGTETDETYTYLAHLLSVRLTDAERASVSALEIETVKRYIAAFVHLLRGLNARGPVILVCEDLHWADAASVDVLRQLVPLLADMRVLCILTARIERASGGWRLVTGSRDMFGDALTEIQLAPLSGDDSRALVASLLRIESLPAATRDLILTKAEGNPFFVEEVIRMLIDRGAIVREEDRWVATDRVVGVEIPDTLQGLLLARIDRLAPETKRTLRVASVIGRQFGVRVLERLLETRTA
jgi:class 3 adenylate cyclase